MFVCSCAILKVFDSLAAHERIQGWGDDFAQQGSERVEASQGLGRARGNRANCVRHWVARVVDGRGSALFGLDGAGEDHGGEGRGDCDGALHLGRGCEGWRRFMGSA